MYSIVTRYKPTYTCQNKTGERLVNLSPVALIYIRILFFIKWDILIQNLNTMEWITFINIICLNLFKT